MNWTRLAKVVGLALGAIAVIIGVFLGMLWLIMNLEFIHMMALFVVFGIIAASFSMYNDPTVFKSDPK